MSRLDLLADVAAAVAEMKWADEASCAEADPEAWFPESGGAVILAKRICMACPVRVQCLEWAITHNERFGIWGGLSEHSRRELSRNRGSEAAA